MMDQDRTAGSFYTSAPCLPSLPMLAPFRDPFGKTDGFTASMQSSDGGQQEPPSSESSLPSSPSTRPSSLAASAHAASRPSPLAVCSRPHGSPSTASSSLSLQPSPFDSGRTSPDGAVDPDTIEVLHPRTHSRRSSGAMTSAGSVNRLCMQLKREHVIYDEEVRGQLPEIGAMKARLHSALPPFANPARGQSDRSEMSIRVLQSSPRYVIRGTILLESRKAAWRKHSKLAGEDREAQTRQLPDLSSIDPWELPIDGSSLLGLGAAGSGGKRTFEFPQYRTDAACKKCTQGSVDCPRCGGLDAVDCFWCASTGYVKGHKCKKCNTTGQIHCAKCDNTGKVKCASCAGMGAFKWALCVDLKMDSLTLPPVTLQDLVDGGQAEDHAAMVPPDAVQYQATQAVFETARQVFETSLQGGSASPGRERRVPVLAHCHVERHTKRLLHVGRWMRSNPAHVEHARFSFSTEEGGQLTRLPFTMNATESRRLQMLDEREQQRLSGGGPGRPAMLEASMPALLSNHIPRGAYV